MDELDNYPVEGKDELDSYPVQSPPSGAQEVNGKANPEGGFVSGLKEIGQGALGTLKSIGSGIMSANRGAAEVIQHPVATLGDERFRTEAMRGVNDTVMPFVGNRLVEAVGGPPKESESDKAAFPDARALGGAAGMAVPIPGKARSLAYMKRAIKCLRTTARAELLSVVRCRRSTRLLLGSRSEAQAM